MVEAKFPFYIHFIFQINLVEQFTCHPFFFVILTFIIRSHYFWYMFIFSLHTMILSVFSIIIILKISRKVLFSQISSSLNHKIVSLVFPFHLPTRVLTAHVLLSTPSSILLDGSANCQCL